MSRPARIAVVLLAVAGAAPAGAADRRCQEVIAAAGRRLVTHALASLTACDARVARGRLPAGTDCAATSAAARAAAVRHAAPIGTACRAAALARGGDCAGMASAGDLAACIHASHDARALAAYDLLGAGAGALEPGARACRLAVGRVLRRFAVARMHVVQRCKRKPPADLRPGTACVDHPRAASRLARVRDEADRAITRRCPDGVIAAASFAPACAGTPSSFAPCMLTAVEVAADAAIAAEFPDPGFCGDAGAAVERRIDELLARMSLDEKIAQMHGAEFPGPAYTAANTRLGVPGLTMVDGPRGVGVTLGSATAFPVGVARGATWDPALEARVGAAMGVEARARGATVLLAPTINLVRHPRWGRTQESYGEDTTHLGRMGAAFVRGVQERRVMASPKHFAVNSIEDTRWDLDVSIDERALREVYLPHFRAVVAEGHAASVMSAYNRVNGQYCGENLHLLREILKGEWGFQGFVESDWVFGTKSTVDAVTAGLDIEMPVAFYYGQKLADAVGAGEVPESLIDDAVRRTLRAQLCFRLDTDPPVVDPTQVGTPEHVAVALEVAHEGIVLLKNAGAVLPLDRGALASVVVVGTLAAAANVGDLGSSTVAPPYVVTALDGIRDRAGAVTITHLPEPLGPGDLATIGAADAAVVVAGLTAADEGEGFLTPGDRDSLVLPRDQDGLIAAVAALNPRTIVVLEGSGPVLMPWLDAVPAVLEAWYPGQEGGHAIADVLFGDVTPSGKLPLSFPGAAGDLPPFDNVSLAVSYDLWHGYRHLDRTGVAPLFPFGFGLSYTTFAYANLTVRPATLSPHGRLRVTADVTNTGTVAGDEVAQLYVGAVGSRVERAVNDLEAFARVHLAPGETQTVAFDVAARDLAFWDTAASGWEVEPIAYRVRVGSSSRDLPLEGGFTVGP